MKLSSLIGKKIVNLKDKIRAYDSSNELLVSNGIVILEGGEVFEIPYKDSEKLSLVNNNTFSYDSLFNENGFFRRVFHKKKYKTEIANRNKREIKGKVIVGVYQFEESNDNDDFNELGGRVIIEMETGYMVSEVGMSPFGTGSAGLYVFKSKEELEVRHEQKLIKIY